MPSNFNVGGGDGAQAIDFNALFDMFAGSYHRTGCAVSVNSGNYGSNNSGLTVDAGEVYLDNALTSVTSTPVDVAPPDQENDRRDLVYVDSTGVVQIEAGDPEADDPPDTTGLDQMRPAPPNLEGIEAVPLYELEVPVNSSGISSGHLIDRRPTSVFARVADFLAHTGASDAHHPPYTNTQARQAVLGGRTVVTGSYTASTVEYILADSATNAIPIELPPPSTDVRVQVIRTTGGSGNDVTIATPGSQTINGLPSITLGAYESATVAADDTAYYLE